MKIKKQQLEPILEQQTVSKLGKGFIKAVYSYCAYLTYAEYIMRNTGLEEAQAGIKIAGRRVMEIKTKINKWNLIKLKDFPSGSDGKGSA